MPDLVIKPLEWTTKSPAETNKIGRDTVNYNTAQGYLDGDRGYSIFRAVSGVDSKPSASFVHRDVNGNEYIWYYVDTLLLRDASTPANIATGLTSTYTWGQFNMGSPAGMSGFFNGTNAQAYIIRTSGGVLEAVLLEMSAPSLSAPTIASGAATWAATGTYQVRICWLDDAGDVVVYTAPSSAQAAVIVNTTDTMTVAEPGSAPARATKWRIALSGVGATDTPSSYVYYDDFAVGSGNQVLTSLPTTHTAQAFNDINGTYRQATLPITGVDWCFLHEGRLIFGSTSSNKVGFSDRDNPNHFYTTNEITSGSESSWNAPVVGGCSLGGKIYIFTRTSTHLVFGSFRRDNLGSNPTYAVDVKTETSQGLVGCVSNNSIVVSDGIGYFFSSRGPAILLGGRIRLMRHADLDHFLRHTLDWTYVTRITAAIDPDLNMVCWLVPRKTNASRPLDGASTAGIPDMMLRWDMLHGILSPPRQLDLVHIATRVNGTLGAQSTQVFLMGMSPQGKCLKLNDGPSGGGVAGAATNTDYDGKLATASTTTSATFTVSGVSAGDYDGMTVLLTYPSTDTNYPNRQVQKTITTQTVSGSSVTVNWDGALTVPSGTQWTVRIAGLKWDIDLDFDPRDYIQVEPSQSFRLHSVEGWLRDTTGHEGIA